MSNLPTFLEPSDTFVNRHIGPGEIDVDAMLKAIGAESLDTLVDQTVPPAIRLKASLGIGHSRTESAVLADLAGIAAENRVLRSLIGMGYYDTIVPPVIQRNILENPGWYTQYTPYQAEIAQGRLEALLNFQTMIADLTGLPLANASLLDEGTACAEAMTMCRAIAAGNRTRFLVADNCHPQTIAVVRGRAEPVGIEVDVASPDAFNFTDDVCGILLQYPATDGRIADYSALVKKAHDAGAVVVFATDLLALTLLKSPGEFGADIAVGSAQRFGVPLGFGGPHAAFIATHEAHARKIPGRIVGVSRDAAGRPALRLAIQTREQHIRRDKASSNICTAQVLLAIMASMYGVYHGPRGLKRIARRVHGFTNLLADSLRSAGHSVTPGALFDTLRITPKANNGSAIIADAEKQGINLRPFVDGSVGISLDERTNEAELRTLLKLFGASLTSTQPAALPADVARTSDFMTHPVFNIYHSETEMLRYIFRLQSRDLSLAQSMIPLGSCTMKLNATSEMLPITWPAFAQMHPFAPHNQTAGYRKMFAQLEDWLARVTGFAAISLQPNAGSQGEYAGLLAIRAYHRSRGDSHRDICLIPTSAHGTNPASAVVAGFKVVAVQCDEHGNVDLNDLRKRVDEHRDNVAALMITYPSTHGVFEEGVKDVCAIVHSAGGQVYMDGANMNAQVGLCRPGDIGADVCHLNLHKTFCIPHGGGGPGMGPIGVAQHLAPFLPSHPVTKPDSLKADGIPPVSAAPYGSAAILPISWVYIALMGDDGLKRATQVAILNANYMAHRLKDHYPMLYAGRNGRVAHEFILDCRSFEKSAGIKVEDIAKRLMDYGYHAPTMSFPVAGTLMIEPTESESRAELDRFCDAMISIREEIRQVEAGSLDRADNPLKHAPHSAGAIASDNWPHKYTREQAAYPMPYLRDFKFWTPVDRIDNPYGDRNLICTCTPMDEIAR